MSKTKNLYLTSAHLYDTCIQRVYNDCDIPFYLSYAKPNDNILEIACGTGRITIPLAKKGCMVTGIDLSRPMLQVLQTNLRFEPQEVQDRINYLECDMIDFDLDKKFDLIIVPLKSFHALTTDMERESCLSCIKSHMNKKTLLIITMFDPITKHFKRQNNIDLDFYDEDLICTVRRHTFIDGHAKAKQITHSHHVFELLQNDKIVDTRIEYLELGYLYDKRAKDLFRKCDLKVKESYGWFDKTPIDENNKRELIYILSK